MSWFSGWSSGTTTTAPAPEATNAPKTAESSNKPKPCCVCKDEKSARDDCMLFSKSDDPAQTDCKPMVEQYKSCMAGFGFKI
ncbi:hypothetical protein UA08_02524 [Talaromyces atroroseus]|uniref:Cytochrome c oxidase copper chaperone n=1 Tax=Talaromyces atroroseus TaxID=1441469 RepID=A0A225AM99_TALAT|nr:hypothetical protein UA08_02524 [Talaromyces atroroseus]OKL62020.1 hypothetical protein UA08_02524 [Talaromyces atroroseus]